MPKRKDGTKILNINRHKVEDKIEEVTKDLPDSIAIKELESDDDQSESEDSYLDQSDNEENESDSGSDQPESEGSDIGLESDQSDGEGSDFDLESDQSDSEGSDLDLESDQSENEGSKSDQSENKKKELIENGDSDVSELEWESSDEESALTAREKIKQTKKGKNGAKFEGEVAKMNKNNKNSSKLNSIKEAKEKDNSKKMEKLSKKETSTNVENKISDKKDYKTRLSSNKKKSNLISKTDGVEEVSKTDEEVKTNTKQNKKTNRPKIAKNNLGSSKVVEKFSNASVDKNLSAEMNSGEKSDSKNDAEESKGTYKEYANENDTSDEEDIRNTVGDIPYEWYGEYPHLGYDWEGKPITKPESGDQLDYFLKRMEDPDFWRTVKDKQTGEEVVLSEKDVELINRIESSKIPDASYDEYAPWVDWFTRDVLKMPLRKFPEHKRSFTPSKIEAKRVSKMVHALKMGWMKTFKEKREERLKKREKQFYMLWRMDDQPDEMRRIHGHIAAPKRLLPGHAESYNPPEEYLFDKREQREWEDRENNSGKKKLHFVPQKYKSMLDVPAYREFVMERFTRCLDLYLAPRARKFRLTIEPEDLLPKLPSPRDLQPFPTRKTLVYEGHSGMVRCLSMDPTGRYLVSGSDDKTIKIWEIATGRCLRTISVNGIVRSLEWCPSKAVALVAVAADNTLLLINPKVGDKNLVKKTDELLKQAPGVNFLTSERVESAVQWLPVSEDLWDHGIRIVINHFKEIKQVTWHGRADYLASVMPDGANRSVLIHQFSTRRSQLPFSKSKGLVQCVLFHPVRPYLFVATQKNIRIYDLVKQELYKKLLTNAKWISSMAIHPGGDNLLVGTYDRKLLWFDLDLSTKPYKVMRLHSTAIRSVAYHKRYPLFASCGDDRATIVSHGMVYNDLLQNPLIVPLKILRDHNVTDDFGVLAIIFHHYQPWIFSSGADSNIILYT